MNLHELSQLYYLRKEIKNDEARLLDLETAAAACTANYGGSTGSPTAGSHSDRTGDYAAAIADIRDIIAEKRLNCLQEQLRLEKYIAGVEDSVVRLAMTCRFVSGLSWQKVARRMGGNNTADSCRMLVKRYLKRG